MISKFCRGPQGVRQSELGQDRNVAALRIPSYALSNLRSFLYPSRETPSILYAKNREGRIHINLSVSRKGKPQSSQRGAQSFTESLRKVLESI